MNRNKSVTTFLVFIMLFLPLSTLQAQVSIGSGEEPISGSILQLKEKDAVTDASSNAHRGLALPRVTLSEKKALYPMFLADPDDPASGPNSAYSGAANKEALDKAHTGLIVYNLTENDDKELCLGLNQWDGEQWNCFQYALGKAVVEISCPDVSIMGSYVESTALTSENKIKLIIDVKKPGAWTASASINGSSNGYSFYASGVFLEKGQYVIYLDGQGMPVSPQNDNFTIKINESNICSTTVKVQSKIGGYDLLCSSTTVIGKYLKGIELDGTNTITIRVNVSKLGSYLIETNESKGIKFSQSGDFTTLGVNTVTLYGTGTPTVNEDVTLTLTANTNSGNATCNVTIPVTLPKMTYAIIGSGGYSWNTSLRLAALTNSNKSFGPDGIVKIKEFTSLWVTTDVNDAATKLNNGYNGQYPDIVLYFAYGASPNDNISKALASYINRGGAIIYGSSDNTASAVNVLMNGIFGISPAQNQISGTYSNADGYQVNNYTDNKVINGPFGNTAGLYWVEDSSSSNSIVMSSLPDGSVQICPASNTWSKMKQSPTTSIVWMNDAKNFIYFGDCVATSSTTTAGDIWYPARYTSDGVPFYFIQQYGSQPGGATPPWGTNANSFLELNSVAYLIKKVATEGGINPH